MIDWFLEHPGWVLAFLTVVFLTLVIWAGVSEDARDNRCQNACNPVRVVACESGASYCADGRMFWRRKGQP